MFFLVGRVLGKRRQGLFGPTPAGVGGEEGLEFGYCFDVSIYAPSYTPVMIVDVSAGLDPRLSANLGIPVHLAIPVPAAHSARSRGLELLRQHDVLGSIIVLLRHHILGLQW